MKMFRNTTNIFTSLFALVIGSVLISCNTDSNKRPSPIAADSTSINGASVKIVYSSPAVKERKIWDGLVPYNEVWRTGANEATFLKTEKDIKINGKMLPKGSYALFTIPTDSSWTIIFNKEWNQWGAYNYNANLDVFRLNVLPKQSAFSERMKFEFQNNQLIFKWENISYSLELTSK